MNRKCNNHTFLILGMVSIISGLLALSFELFAIQYFHYYTWSKNIGYFEPKEFISVPTISWAVRLTSLVIIAGIILVLAGLFSPKEKQELT